MGQIRDLWLRWKMLRLPWRKKFLIGQDLQGNTFWEFKDQLNHNRFRRIVKFRRRTHFSDVAISPQWHQWLRQTRHEPPTMQEQAADLQRQSILKHNARLADERWAAKAKYIEKPRPAEAPPRQLGDAKFDHHHHGDAPAAGQRNPSEQSRPRVTTPHEPHERGAATGANPGDNFQPEAWTPAPAKR